MTLLKRLAIASCAAFLAACGGGGDDQPVYQVTYSASGAAPLDVTYGTPGAGVVQERSPSGSFELAFAARAGDPLFVSGQTAGAVTSPTTLLTFVSASITVNGSVFRAAAARGMATASGTCC